MSEPKDVYDGWNDDGNLPPIKCCPFCGGNGILCSNGYEKPVIDSNTGAYVDMDIFEGDIFWCSCESCGAMGGGEPSTPEDVINMWNKRTEKREESHA